MINIDQERAAFLQWLASVGVVEEIPLWEAWQARAQQPSAEPFGYFRAEPFGWTDCAETDEGAIALYEHPAADVQLGWRPIETAPKNTPILVTDGVVMVVVQRGECAGKDWPDPVGFGGYEWEFGFDWEDLTHWMPLPAAPEAQ